MAELLLVATLTFLAVVLIGGAILGIAAARRKALHARLRDSLSQDGESKDSPSTGKLLRALNRIGQTVSPGGTPSRSLGAELARAGYYGKSAPAVYVGTKVLLLLIGLAVPAFFLIPTDIKFHIKLSLIVVSGGLMFFVPGIFLEAQRKKRCSEINIHLPDAVDLLEICVSSGMGLDMAWNLITDEVRGVSTVLADEMALTTLEVHLGAPRVAAMQHMGERTGAEEVSTLAGLLVQSERFGTSIADTLRTFAVSMRDARSMQGQEAAEKAAVKLLLPMVLFIFPAVLVVLAGPAAVRLVKVMSG